MAPFHQTMAQSNQDSRPVRRSRLVRGAALGLAILLSACSSDSGGVDGPQGPSTTNEFAVDSSNVINGATWQLNRPIQVTFNKDVDFTTVSQTTIQIVDGQGVPAVGAFSRVNSRTIRFQPVCPTNATNTNGGLLQGRNYRLTIPSESTPGIGGGLTVQSTSGERLVNGLALNFNTPTSTDPLVLFVDQQPGAPAVRVRGLGIEPLDSPAGSYVEFPGLDQDGDGVPDREYIVFDPLAQQGNIGREVPLNLYSDPTQQFAFVLRFNQAVFAAPSNINSSRLAIEYFNPASGQWQTVPSTVQLLSNCTAIGAEVRLAPEGVVPQGSEIRAVVREGFADLTNDAVPAALTNFARVESTVANPGAMNPGDGADEIREPFDVGGDAAGSREDIEIASANPRANWAEIGTPGTLTASFDFGGTGGPAGEFDWVIPAGVDLIISTDADVIQGGPDGTPIYQQPIIGGLINVRRMVVETNASVQFIGSNTVTILATGSVEIRGEVAVNGGDSRGVGTLNTTNMPEPGAPGNGGGGDGGIGSFQTNQSTARGGTGQGAFGVPGLGGQGGETGYASGGTCAKEDRRGAGGGGGGFGRDVFYLDLVSGLFARCQMLVGMDVERGIVGSFDGTGAVSQTLPAQGGDPGPDPFTDPNQDNDFLGVITLSDGRQIRGELPSLWAGAGGGAGGDASRTNTFPQTPFQITGDEKGSGAGGGAGGIEILAIGDISIVGQGQLSADGGTGNGGENSIFFDRIGGGSGGGSGGHVVLSSANRIVIESEATGTSVGAFYDDSVTTLSHIKRPLRALGGQNGAGRESRCGANENGEMTWARDSIPVENFAGNLDVPPNSSMNENGALNWARVCSTNGSSGNFATCQIQPNRGETFGAGGDGAPGIIQLHVSDPATQLVFGAQGGGVYGVDADPTFSMAPPPLGWTAPADPVDLLVPFFSARSESFTEWIPLGLARLNPDGTTDQVEFLFGGTDPMTGIVERSGTTAEELPALIDYTSLALDGGGAGPSVEAQTGVFTFPDASFVGGPALEDFYKANASLLREFVVRIRDNGNPATATEFIVQSASYDEMAGEFTVVVDTRDVLGDTLAGFVVPEVEFVPFFFRLESATVSDAYPIGTEVAILFDAARVNSATGEPSTNPADIFSGGDTAAFTPDITDLNNDVWDFVRVKFEFLIDINELGSPRPGLDFVKVPFRF